MSVQPTETEMATESKAMPCGFIVLTLKSLAHGPKHNRSGAGNTEGFTASVLDASLIQTPALGITIGVTLSIQTETTNVHTSWQQTLSVTGTSIKPEQKKVGDQVFISW